MPDLTAKRTLVKSPPELWEELSEVEGLAKHVRHVAWHGQETAAGDRNRGQCRI